MFLYPNAKTATLDRHTLHNLNLINNSLAINNNGSGNLKELLTSSGGGNSMLSPHSHHQSQAHHQQQQAQQQSPHKQHQQQAAQQHHSLNHQNHHQSNAHSSEHYSSYGHPRNLNKINGAATLPPGLGGLGSAIAAAIQANAAAAAAVVAANGTTGKQSGGACIDTNTANPASAGVYDPVSGATDTNTFLVHHHPLNDHHHPTGVLSSGSNPNAASHQHQMNALVGGRPRPQPIAGTPPPEICDPKLIQQTCTLFGLNLVRSLIRGHIDISV